MKGPHWGWYLLIGILTLAPATAELLECAVDADNVPKVYADDLSTDKFKADAVEVRVRINGTAEPA